MESNAPSSGRGCAPAPADGLLDAAVGWGVDALECETGGLAGALVGALDKAALDGAALPGGAFFDPLAGREGGAAGFEVAADGLWDEALGGLGGAALDGAALGGKALDGATLDGLDGATLAGGAFFDPLAGREGGAAGFEVTAGGLCDEGLGGREATGG